jgi:hypothetical protein
VASTKTAPSASGGCERLPAAGFGLYRRRRWPGAVPWFVRYVTRSRLCHPLALLVALAVAPWRWPPPSDVAGAFTNSVAMASCCDHAAVPGQGA